jgi:hypothetical protein
MVKTESLFTVLLWVLKLFFSGTLGSFVVEKLDSVQVCFTPAESVLHFPLFHFHLGHLADAFVQSDLQ